jgi:hypothetical protein
MRLGVGSASPRLSSECAANQSKRAGNCSVPALLSHPRRGSSACLLRRRYLAPRALDLLLGAPLNHGRVSRVVGHDDHAGVTMADPSQRHRPRLRAVSRSAVLDKPPCGCGEARLVGRTTGKDYSGGCGGLGGWKPSRSSGTLPIPARFDGDAEAGARDRRPGVGAGRRCTGNTRVLVRGCQQTTRREGGERRRGGCHWPMRTKPNQAHLDTRCSSGLPPLRSSAYRRHERPAGGGLDAGSTFAPHGPSSRSERLADDRLEPLRLAHASLPSDPPEPRLLARRQHHPDRLRLRPTDGDYRPRYLFPLGLVIPRDVMPLPERERFLLGCEPGERLVARPMASGSSGRLRGAS